MEKLKGQATDEQIQEWKNKHKDVYQVSGGGFVCYLRKPYRKEVSIAMSKSFSDPLSSSESIMQSCWLGGATELQTEDRLFLGVHAQIQNIIDQEEMSVKKL